MIINVIGRYFDVKKTTFWVVSILYEASSSLFQKTTQGNSLGNID